MGIFKIKAQKDAFEKIGGNKLIRNITGFKALSEIPISEVSVSFRMSRPPKEDEVDLLSKKLEQCGIDIQKIKANWIEC